MDLDERELYSEDEFAAHDSGSEDEAEAAAAAKAAEEDGLSLGNVELEAAPRQRQPLPFAVDNDGFESEVAQLPQLPTWQFSGKRKQRQDGRVLLLFDINGVLMQHRWDGVSHQHDLRPGVHHLLRLVPHFRLGIYSSATRPTVTKALHKLQGNLANFLQQRRVAAAAAAPGAAASGGGKKKKRKKGAAAAAGAAAGAAVDADGFPVELPKQLFEVVMARDHCVPAEKEDIEARGGRPWDTVKPLHKYFNGLARVALVDDSAHKAAPKEGANMLVMPCWHGPTHPLGRGDACLPLLVDELLAWIVPHTVGTTATAAGDAAEAAGAGAEPAAAPGEATEAAAPVADVRLATAGISAKLAAAAQQQLEEARAAGQLTQEQAAAAAAVVEAAVSGSAAVAAAAAAAAEAGFDATSPERPAAQQQQRKRPAEQEAAGEAGAAAADEAGETAAQPLTKKQRRQLHKQEGQQNRAAAGTVLLAAAATVGAAAAEPGSGSATLAEINEFLNNWQPALGAALLNKSAKKFLAAAEKAGLVQPLPEGKSAPAGTAAAAGGRRRPGLPGLGHRLNDGRQYQLTPAGAAALLSKQELLDLGARCTTVANTAGSAEAQQAGQPAAAPAAPEGKQGGKRKRRQGGGEGAEEQAQQDVQQAQQGQQAAGDDADMLDVDAGFFWQQKQQPAAGQGEPQAQGQAAEEAAAGAPAAAAAGPNTSAQASQPQLTLGEARAAAQQGLVLYALAQLQQRQGACFADMEVWVHQELRAQQPQLPLWDASAPKVQKALARALRVWLQRGLDACEQNKWLVSGGQAADVPPVLMLWSAGPYAPPTPAAAEVAAALETLAAALHPSAGSAREPAAAQPADAATGAAAAPAAAAAAAAAGPAAAQAAAAAPTAAQAAAEPAASGEAAASEAAAGGQGEGEAAVPLLLDVFEDKAPVPAALAGTAGGAAAAQAAAAAGEAAAAEPAPLAVFEDRAPAPLAPQQAQQAQQQQAQPQPPGAQQQPQAVQQQAAAQEGARFEPSMTVEQLRAEHKRYLKSVAAQLGGGRLAPAQRAVYKQLKKEAEKRLKAELSRRNRTGKKAAAEVLDRLFEAASGGSEEAWAAAVGQLTDAERAAVASQGVDLEQYRQRLAARAAGASGREGAGSEGEGGGSEGGSEDEEELSGSEAEAEEGSEQEEGSEDEDESEWSTASDGEEEEAAGPGASFFWERSQRAQRTQRAQQGLSPLHFEVEAFAQRATPTQQEAEAVQSAVLAVDAAARELWPHSRVALFGSQATGLALPGSDLDIVVLGVGATLARAGSGFTHVQRKQLSELLEDLLDVLLKRKLLSGQAQIIEAKVPIIKCKLQFGGGLAADISLGAENGAHAVDFVRRQVLAVPPLRPLCLAVKAFLRERGQNEVFTGGLSSYSLFNMVMAHLQCEGFKPDMSAQQAQQGKRGWRPPPPRPADLEQTLAFLQQLAAGALPAMSEAAAAAHAAGQRSHVRFGDDSQEGAAPSQNQPQADLGVLLWGFFDRFGNRFSYSKQAVSIRLGGVCTKLKAWRQARKPWLLAVEDPQEMGKDVGSGSFAVREIKEAFAEAAELLAEVCEDLDANEAAVAGAPAPSAAAEAAAAAAAAAAEPGTSAEAAAAGGQEQEGRQGAGSRPRQTLLAGVLDVEAAVGRSAAAQRARQAIEKRAAAKSQKVLHERIRSGVMLRRQPTAKQQTRMSKMARKAERKAKIKADNEEYQERQRAKRERLKGKRQGSRRGAAVEAQWGSNRGQYKDFSDEEWSLRKQKKPKKKKGQQQQQQQQGGGAQNNGGGGGGGKKKKQKQKQQKQQQQKQQKKRQSQGGGGQGGGGSASKKARHN